MQGLTETLSGEGWGKDGSVNGWKGSQLTDQHAVYRWKQLCTFFLPRMRSFVPEHQVDAPVGKYEPIITKTPSFSLQPVGLYSSRRGPPVLVSKSECGSEFIGYAWLCFSVQSNGISPRMSVTQLTTEMSYLKSYFVKFTFYMLVSQFPLTAENCAFMETVSSS